MQSMYGWQQDGGSLPLTSKQEQSLNDRAGLGSSGVVQPTTNTRGNTSSGGGGRQRARDILTCQVEGCNADLSDLREYHQRYKICEHHLKVDYIVRDGCKQRFCQQCGRFHLLEAFDDQKRSCRERLRKHNARRRRKAQAASEAAQAAAADASDGAAAERSNSAGRSEESSEPSTTLVKRDSVSKRKKTKDSLDLLTTSLSNVSHDSHLDDNESVYDSRDSLEQFSLGSAPTQRERRNTAPVSRNQLDSLQSVPARSMRRQSQSLNRSNSHGNLAARNTVIHRLKPLARTCSLPKEVGDIPMLWQSSPAASSPLSSSVPSSVSPFLSHQQQQQQQQQQHPSSTQAVPCELLNGLSPAQQLLLGHRIRPPSRLHECSPVNLDPPSPSRFATHRTIPPTSAGTNNAAYAADQFVFGSGMSGAAGPSAVGSGSASPASRMHHGSSPLQHASNNSSVPSHSQVQLPFTPWGSGPVEIKQEPSDAEGWGPVKQESFSGPQDWGPLDMIGGLDDIDQMQGIVRAESRSMNPSNGGQDLLDSMFEDFDGATLGIDGDDRCSGSRNLNAANTLSNHLLCSYDTVQMQLAQMEALSRQEVLASCAEIEHALQEYRQRQLASLLAPGTAETPSSTGSPALGAPLNIGLQALQLDSGHVNAHMDAMQAQQYQALQQGLQFEQRQQLQQQQQQEEQMQRDLQQQLWQRQQQEQLQRDWQQQQQQQQQQQGQQQGQQQQLLQKQQQEEQQQQQQQLLSSMSLLRPGLSGLLDLPDQPMLDHDASFDSAQQAIIDTLLTEGLGGLHEAAAASVIPSSAGPSAERDFAAWFAP